MSFLGWMRRDKYESAVGGPKSEHFTAKGNAIEPEWRSKWSPDDTGLTETRLHVGRSSEGFHAGVEEAFRAGAGRIAWGDAQPTPERARAEAREVERKRRDEIDVAHGSSSPGKIPDRLAALFDEWRQDGKLSRLRDETGQEPEAGRAVQKRTPYLGR